MEETIVLILIVVSLVLAIIDVVQSNGKSLVGWAVVVLDAALLFARLA